MSDAITRMVAYLVMSPGWRADRWDHTGPNFHPTPAKRERISPERDPGLKARILTELQKGEATSEVMAKKLRLPQREVGAKLSRLFLDGHVERALSAISPHTGRAVLLYWLRESE